ncbi:unnamed protein product, partial [Rotaria sordida]
MKTIPTTNILPFTTPTPVQSLLATHLIILSF